MAFAGSDRFRTRLIAKPTEGNETRDSWCERTGDQSDSAAIGNVRIRTMFCVARGSDPPLLLGFAKIIVRMPSFYMRAKRTLHL